ncbi:MAG: hypothetical protein ACTHN5_05340 [Phycisphaerae bacterium]
MDSVLTFWIAAVWGAAVLASWVGWGTLIGFLMSRERRFDWGLRAAWGMGATLGMGGVLVALGMATATVLQVVVMGGAAAWGMMLYGVKRGRTVERVGWGWKWPVMVLGVAAYLGSVGATTSVDLNWSDDLPIYLPLVKRMVQTGNVEEPYSLRRLSSYGGQWLLQGEVMAVGTESNGMLVDKGLAAVVMAGLVWGMGRGSGGKGAACTMAATLAALLVDVPRVNTQSQMTGVGRLVGLRRTLESAGEADGDWRKLGGMAGVMAAGLASLRMNYLPVAGLVLVVGYGVRAFGERRRALAGGAIALGGMAVLVAPWAGALWESSRSLFYPVMLGNQRAEYSGMYERAMGIGGKAGFVAGYFAYWKAALLVVPVVLLMRRRSGGGWASALAVYAGAICGTAAVAWVFTAISDETLYRYTFPMLFAGAICAVGVALREGVRGWRGIGAVAWIVVVVAVNVVPSVKEYWRGMGEVVAWNTRPRVFAPPRLVDEYVAAQRSMPAGAGVYVAASMPSLLDFSRNRVCVGDELGVVAPDPGIPVFEGAEAVRMYFLSKGIHYVMAVDFDSALGLYSRPVWERFRAAQGQPVAGDVIEHNLAPVVLKMEEDLDALAAEPGRTSRFGPLRVIRLD